MQGRQSFIHANPPPQTVLCGGAAAAAAVGAAATTAIAGLAGLGCGDIAIAAQGRPLCPSSLFPPPLCQLAAAAFSFLFFLQGRKGLKTFSRIV